MSGKIVPSLMPSVLCQAIKNTCTCKLGLGQKYDIPLSATVSRACGPDAARGERDARKKDEPLWGVLQS